MHRTRIKICGITRREDGRRAAELGADFVGLNFFTGPRMVTWPQAQGIVASIYPNAAVPIALTGALPDPENEFPTIDEIRRALPVHDFQLYPMAHAYRKAFAHMKGIEYWAVVRVAHRAVLTSLREQFAGIVPAPSAFLLDTATSEKLGGTGRSFNWNWIAESREAGELHGLPPLVLAGGLTPDNVADAIRIAQPYAVDVSSGVEVAGQPGIKDPIKMRDFIQAVRGTDETSD